MRFKETIEGESNLRLRVRERGKLITSREVHNIWLASGANWMVRLMSLQAGAPVSDYRIRYMGFGIGGVRQALATVTDPASTNPVRIAYPGSNRQTDTDPAVIRLERPVRVSGGGTAYPGAAGDIWLGEIGSVSFTDRAVTYRRVFTEQEISYGAFLSVPLSEIALVTSGVSPSRCPVDYTLLAATDPSYLSAAPMVAYDVFDPISKTGSFEVEAEWSLRA